MAKRGKIYDVLITYSPRFLLGFEYCTRRSRERPGVFYGLVAGLGCGAE